MGDLLAFFPRSYEDRTRVAQVTELQEGVASTLELSVLSARKIPIRRMGRSMLEVRASDASGVVTLKWFRVPYGMDSSFKAGAKFRATGTPKKYMNQMEILHPEISWNMESQEIGTGRVIPIYVELDGIPNRTLRKVLWNAIESFAKHWPEEIPHALLDRYGLPEAARAVREIHFPENTPIEELLAFRGPAHRRMIFEEFFKFEYLVLKKRQGLTREPAVAYLRHTSEGAVNDLLTLLPFSLTGGQRQALEDILTDLSHPHPMNRLVQGDVGSGKTAVALLAAGAVIAQGGQVALMAPTEILAEQHRMGAEKLLHGKIACELLTGRSSTIERKRILTRLQSGEPILLIGTHALLEDPVEFVNLTLAMIDEQHRFGVEQRQTLREKGRGTVPHTLILTATPIPRTLALTAYGDLEVSSITELPPGRTPIRTHVVKPAQIARAYERIRQELQSGRQAYFIFPLVAESEAEGFTALKAATLEAERLQKEVFPEFKVGLLHGKLSGSEKVETMRAFKACELQILVSTTVVEVGVDVPNATVMVVEHAERFGLSQLHQLRGRVGRGGQQSWCFLFPSGRVSEDSSARLGVLEEFSDGFKIAEADLEIRGPGEFLGTRQAGALPFKIGNLVRDRELLLQARVEAEKILLSDPELTQTTHAPLRAYLNREGAERLERLKTS